MKTWLFLLILLLSSSSFSQYKEREGFAKYKIKEGLIYYDFYTKKNLRPTNCIYYFENFGSKGYVTLIDRDSTISQYLIRDSIYFKLLKDSVLIQDTFFSLTNLLLKEAGLDFRFNFGDSIHKFGKKFTQIWHGRILKTWDKWGLNREVYGGGYLEYKGIPLKINQLLVQEKQSAKDEIILLFNMRYAFDRKRTVFHKNADFSIKLEEKLKLTERL
jgi:hypothetical protein